MIYSIKVRSPHKVYVPIMSVPPIWGTNPPMCKQPRENPGHTHAINMNRSHLIYQVLIREAGSQQFDEKICLGFFDKKLKIAPGDG